jgi:outer membrane protein OmpA-like peptidoglycan-associated protein
MILSVIRCAFLFTFLCSMAAQAQDYFVVIGAFAEETTASKFTGYARSMRYDARYIRNESNKLFYVYVLKTTDRRAASELTVRLQRETEFTDAWMYTGIPTKPLEVELFREPEVLAEPPVVEPENREESISPDLEVEPTIAFDGPEKPVARGKFFKFILTTTEGKEVSGRVYNVDRIQGRDLATYTAHQYVDVLKPIRQDQSVTLVCEIFGYKEEVKLVDYADPSSAEGAYQDEHGAWVIPFTLERLQKGNISVLYNVAFYKDAVIMLPKSKPELDELVNMMKLNPNYSIKIHGHHNGTERNIRIITLGNDKNYFNMARSSSKMGSAKDLSRLRAETIKSYLVDNGIEKNRIDTYAWGGTAMLIKPGTAAATRLNNRIEIEILQD